MILSTLTTSSISMATPVHKADTTASGVQANKSEPTTIAVSRGFYAAETQREETGIRQQCLQRIMQHH